MSSLRADPVTRTPCHVLPSGRSHQMRGAASNPTPLTKKSNRQLGARIG